MNFTSFPILGPAPQFISNVKVEEVQTQTNILNHTVATSVNNSLYQESNHIVPDYCDKSVFTTAPSQVLNTNANQEERSYEWLNASHRNQCINSVESEKKIFNTFAVAPSHGNQTMGLVWQTKTMTQNASTMTDLEMPENLCKSGDDKGIDEVSESLTDENGFISNGNWSGCSRIHLQRQENAMAVYLARLQPSTLPLGIQQFLNRYNLKPVKDDLSKTKPKSRCDFKPRNSEITVTTNVDGSTLYCCPECRIAYPERDRLEAHMAGNKTVVFFIFIALGKS